jgi:hypothetical protein
MTTAKIIMLLFCASTAFGQVPNFRALTAKTAIENSAVPDAVPLRWYQGESLTFSHTSTWQGANANWTSLSNLVAVWILTANKTDCPDDTNVYLWATGSVVAASGTVSFAVTPEQSAAPASNYWSFVTLYKTDAAGLTNEYIGVLHRANAYIGYRNMHPTYVGPWQVPSNMVDSYARARADAAHALASQYSPTITNSLASTSYVHQAVAGSTQNVLFAEADTLATVVARGNAANGGFDFVSFLRMFDEYAPEKPGIVFGTNATAVYGKNWYFSDSGITFSGQPLAGVSAISHTSGYGIDFANGMLSGSPWYFTGSVIDGGTFTGGIITNGTFHGDGSALTGITAEQIGAVTTNAPAWLASTNYTATVTLTNDLERPLYLYATGAVSLAFSGLRPPQPVYLIVKGPSTLTFQSGTHFVGGASWQTNQANHFIVWQTGTNIFVNPITTSED